jgi:hypothetical protein
MDRICYETFATAEISLKHFVRKLNALLKCSRHG